MNLFKSSLLSLFISLSVLTPASSFAAATPATTPTTVQANQGSLVATVNIDNARIISQKGNTFTIAFSLSNRQGLQTGVKYGIQLVPDGAKYIADEKVYDESITLYENSVIKREIAYTAPSQFSGNFTLYILSNNESNFPFGVVSLGKIKLTATTKGINILNDSCYVQVEGEKGSPHYGITQGVDINANESLRLTCSAVNQTSTLQSVTPFFETRYSSAYGKTAPQNGGDFTVVSFAKNEKKTFSFLLPKGASPQFYNLKVGLMNADVASNNISVRYIISGATASIQKLSLDKDYYTFGDSGEISMIWSASSGSFARSNASGTGIPTVSLSATVTNSSGVECISPISQTLTRSLTNPETKIPFTIKATCTNPHVSVTLTDDKGSTLDQKDFVFTSSGDHTAKPLSSKTLILVIVVLLLIIIVGVNMKKRKNTNNTIQ